MSIPICWGQVNVPTQPLAESRDVRDMDKGPALPYHLTACTTYLPPFVTLSHACS